MENGNVPPPYLPGQPGRGLHSHLAIPGSNDHAAMMNQFQGMTLGGMNMGSAPAPLHMGASYMLGPEGQFVLAPMPGSQSMGLGHSNDNGYNAFSLNGAYGNPYVGVPVPLMPFTPGRPTTTHHRVDRGHSDVPGLENRRGSYSTTESTPATPFYTGISHRENGPRVASLDRSTYTTPSPQQMGLSALHVDAPAKAAPPTVSDHALDELLKKNPAVPKAVPAVFTPPGQMKSLEQSLENRIPGNRNVYIRGLHPTTDDELLYQFATRFGPVETSKAIIDTGTGACKGFGFAKFYDVADSEICIRGFYRLGYEVGFARESFNSRLKAEGDELSTNLYISNLPKTLTEVELGTIFLGYTILSSKILRDSMGNSRGVGFARFENRDVCDDIIRKFNGVGIGEEGLLMNIRYADTPAQKELKRVTAERRQFRTNEYNIGAYGTPLVGMNPTLYGSQPQQWRRPIQHSEAMQPDPLGPTMVHCSTMVCRVAIGAFSNRLTRTATSSSADEAIATPASSECDESVTIHADTIVVSASLDSSPSVKKEASVKKETQ
ncbi:sporulation-specific protein [Ilyonectria robusta]|uniref:sporulation-specific protein n=1 Tax=Ilyonectria robusta TaxID=1079257 RepID=UPI001E8E3928|nr:sporulation-specific protein [Ilyonectria robusta]KAH8735986.1 sporulation-specific protein [Ilyonectria robusta]